MRIIAGTHRGRKLVTPEGKTTRPMTDRVRENLFNILGPGAADGAAVLDLFCGCGALGVEALSRGAASCTFVDADRDAVSAVETNCEQLGLADRVRIERRDALRPGGWIGQPGRPYTLVFVDPPYNMTADTDGQTHLAHVAATLGRLRALAPGAVAMLRAKRGVVIERPWPEFDAIDTRSYGTTTLHLMAYRPTARGEETE
ncbi:MAG TPA: 16S rRNA (guanine(966)-N(2))-methyltransferase RsmD [Phycisphaerae bacterium]|nr:16S rRNA (guanine(966)-N(2))-methyltransferase RsmD [Phycisphaerae bacterium]